MLFLNYGTIVRLQRKDGEPKQRPVERIRERGRIVSGELVQSFTRSLYRPDDGYFFAPLKQKFNSYQFTNTPRRSAAAAPSWEPYGDNLRFPDSAAPQGYAVSVPPGPQAFTASPCGSGGAESGAAGLRREVNRFAYGAGLQRDTASPRRRPAVPTSAPRLRPAAPQEPSPELQVFAGKPCGSGGTEVVDYTIGLRCSGTFEWKLSLPHVHIKLVSHMHCNQCNFVSTRHSHVTSKTCGPGGAEVDLGSTSSTRQSTPQVLSLEPHGVPTVRRDDTSKTCGPELSSTSSTCGSGGAESGPHRWHGVHGVALRHSRVRRCSTESGPRTRLLRSRRSMAWIRVRRIHAVTYGSGGNDSAPPESQVMSSNSASPEPQGYAVNTVPTVRSGLGPLRLRTRLLRSRRSKAWSRVRDRRSTTCREAEFDVSKRRRVVGLSDVISTLSFSRRLGSILVTGDKLHPLTQLQTGGHVTHLSRQICIMRKVETHLIPRNATRSQTMLKLISDPGLSRDINEWEGLFSIPYKQSDSTSDISAGIPRIEALFESKVPKDVCGYPLRVFATTYVCRLWTALFYSGIFSPVLGLSKSLETVQKNLVTQIHGAYLSQGVTMIHLHLEIIVKQLTTSMAYLWDYDQVGTANIGKRSLYTLENTLPLHTNAREKHYKPSSYAYTFQFLGLTKRGLRASSFLSIISFQEIRRSLHIGSYKGVKDPFSGLKSALIVGENISMGTTTELQKSLLGSPR